MLATNFELSVLYFSAVGACGCANCAMDDDSDEDLDSYIRNRLYFALYNMTEFLIVRLGHKVPDALEYRLYRIPELYGSSFRVPPELVRLVRKDIKLYREDLALIGQIMDQWFAIKCAQFRCDCLPCAALHSYVG